MNILAEGHIHGELMTLIQVLIKKIIALSWPLYTHITIEKQELNCSTLNVSILLTYYQKVDSTPTKTSYSCTQNSI